MAQKKHFIGIDPETAIGDQQFEKDFPYLPHSAYEWERMIAGYIQAGDVEGYQEMIRLMEEVGQMESIYNIASRSLTQGKYLAVSFITIVTRLAISSGGDELKAYQISDDFLYRLEKISNIKDLLQTLNNSSIALIQTVQDASQSDAPNLYYTRCKEYIANHIGEKLTAAVLADVCGLTPNYLSMVFKKASGKTLKEYITDLRIQTAKQLLLSPNHTTSEISTFLGFASQSHFIETFKKKVGTTPQRWCWRQDRNNGLSLYGSSHPDDTGKQ